MATTIQKLDLDELLIEQDADGWTQLIGLFVALPGAYLYCQLLRGWYEYAVSLMRGQAGAWEAIVVTLPGMIVTLFLGACFLVPGVMLFSWTKIFVDRKAQILTKVRCFALYQAKKNYPLTNFSQVEIVLSIPGSQKAKRDYVDLLLRGEKGGTLILATFTARDIEEGVETAERIADFLGLEYRNKLGDWLSKTHYRPHKIWEAGWWVSDLPLWFRLLKKGFSSVRSSRAGKRLSS